MVFSVCLLKVLETCVKNCGHRFHALVATQDFVEGVLVRSILPKYNPPTILHDRVLSLIQVCVFTGNLSQTFTRRDFIYLAWKAQWARRWPLRRMTQHHIDPWQLCQALIVMKGFLQSDCLVFPESVICSCSGFHSSCCALEQGPPNPFKATDQSNVRPDAFQRRGCS